MSTSDSRSLGARVMAGLAWFVDRWAGAIVIGGLVLLVVSGAQAWFHLQYAGDRSQVLTSDAPYYRDQKAFNQEFGSTEAIFFIVRGKDVEKNRKATLDIGNQARQEAEAFDNVVDKIDLAFVRTRLLLFLPVPALEDISSRMQEARYLLERVLEHPALAPLMSDFDRQVQRWLKAQLGQGPPPSGGANETVASFTRALPVLTRLLQDMTDVVSSPHATYQSPLRSAMGTQLQMPAIDVMQDLWISFDDGHTFLVSADPRLSAGANAEPAVQAAQRIVESARARNPGVTINVTGMPVISADEMQVAEEDSTRATVVSLVGVAVLFFLAFHNLTRALLAMCCLMVALVATLGFMSITVGHLNVLTVTGMPMLVGLGIDFGIQVICRYEEERTYNGLDPSAAMAATLENTGASILTAGLTTAVSFAVTGLAGFAGVRELGVLAGGGIIISTATMLVLLPAVILYGERSRFAHSDAVSMREASWNLLTQGERYMLTRPHQVIAIGVLVTAYLGWHLSGVTFDWNVLDLQDQSASSVVAASELLRDTNRSILGAAVVADDIEQARVLQKRLSALPSVSSVMSVAMMIPTDQQQKIPLVRGLQTFLRTLPPIPTGAPPAVDIPLLVSSLTHLRSVGLLALSEAQHLGENASATLQAFVASADDLLLRIEDAGASAQHRLDTYQRDLSDNLIEKLRLVVDPNEVTPITYEVLPSSLRHMLVGRTGKLLLQVSPRYSVWDRQGMELFINEIRSVTDQVPSADGKTAMVTGSVVQIYESTRLAIEGYERIALYALAAIVILVVLHFRGPRRSILALTPLGLGLIWMFGLQGALGLPFNVINMLVLPLILGVGVANGIYVVRRFDEEGTAFMFSRSTGRAILLSNLAAIIGFGSLLVSHYHAMYSFGVLMSLGVGTCMLASLIILPAILTLIAARRKRAARGLA